MIIEIWVTLVRVESFPETVVEQLHSSGKDWWSWAKARGLRLDKFPEASSDKVEWSQGSSCYTTHYRTVEVPDV